MTGFLKSNAIVFSPISMCYVYTKKTLTGENKEEVFRICSQNFNGNAQKTVLSFFRSRYVYSRGR